MQSLLSLAAVLTAARSALSPTLNPDIRYLPLTITLNNEVSGASAQAGIDTSGHSFTFGYSLFSNTILDRNGTIFATRIQLSFPDGPLPSGKTCGVYTGGWQDVKTIGTLNGTHTFLDLDGNNMTSVETDVTDWVISCDTYIVGQE